MLTLRFRTITESEISITGSYAFSKQPPSRRGCGWAAQSKRVREPRGGPPATRPAGGPDGDRRHSPVRRESGDRPAAGWSWPAAGSGAIAVPAGGQHLPPATPPA